MVTNNTIYLNTIKYSLIKFIPSKEVQYGPTLAKVVPKYPSVFQIVINNQNIFMSHVQDCKRLPKMGYRDLEWQVFWQLLLSRPLGWFSLKVAVFVCLCFVPLP